MGQTDSAGCAAGRGCDTGGDVAWVGGAGTDGVAVKTVCAQCEGSGLLVETDERGNRFARECGCRVGERVERALAQARIPKRYEFCSLANYETTHAFADPSMREAAKMAEWFAASYPVSTRGQGLLFVGSSGLGKTHLAVGILRALVSERGVIAQFWEHKELLDKLRSIYSMRVAGAEDRLMRSLITCDLLVLDDLGDITPSEWSWDTTAYLLNARYNENLSTIITTNLANQPSALAVQAQEVPSASVEVRRAIRRETLGDRIGERMRSRLQEMCVEVEVQGTDFRSTKKRASFGRGV